MPTRKPPPPPPPPPPPSGDGPPPPRRITAQEATDAAAAALARGNATFNTAVGRLGERSAQFGLDVEGAGASVWPVLGVFAMAVALVVDRLKDVHAVPVRWMLVLLVLGAAVVAGELRRGRFRALDSLPPWATTTGLRLAMLLTLAAQLTNFLSVGIVQVLWWLATILVAVPVVRGHQAVRAFGLGGRTVTPEQVGGLAVFTAIVVGLLPKQGDVGTLWSVVAGLSAAAVIALSLRTIPYAEVVLDIAALLVVGVAVVGASLTIVGLLWIAAAWLLGSSRWRATAGSSPRPAWRSWPALAMVGSLLAVGAMFGTFDNFQGAGYYSGGLTYSYDSYSEDYGYNYDAFAYYNPGFFWATSGRGQDGAPLAVAGFVALAALARRRGSGDRRVTYAAAAVAVGGFLWVAFSGSLHYFPVWVAAAGSAVTIGWSGRAAWQARQTHATPAAAPSGAPPAPPPGHSEQSPAPSAR